MFNTQILATDIMTAVPLAQGGDSQIVNLFGKSQYQLPPSAPIGGGNANRFSVMCNYTVNTPANKNFLYSKYAVLTNQGVTLTAVTSGVAGNSITLTLVNPGTTTSASVLTTGNNIVVTLGYALGAVTTTATSLVSLLNADGTTAALVTASGSGASILTALAQTPLASGANSSVSTVNSSVTITGHGYSTGLAVTLVQTSGTLPTGLATSTTYYLIVLDANTIQFATTLVHAVAGTFITLTGSGSVGGSGTVTVTAVSGCTLTLNCSNDSTFTNWVAIQSATTVSSSGSIILSVADVSYQYFKITKAITTGSVTVQGLVNVVGDGQ